MPHLSIPPLAPGYYALFLEGFSRQVRLGVLPEEVRPQPVRLDIAVVARRLGEGDRLEAVLDYNHLRDSAIALIEERHFGLQETLCEALIDRIGSHPAVAGVIVESRKTAVYADAGAVGCSMAVIDPEALSA